MITTEDLRMMDDVFGDDMIKLIGPSLLSFPDGIDGSRLNMLSQNTKAILILKNGDVPRIFTGEENNIGKHSKGYKKLKGEWEVVKKIRKFGNHIYSLVLYNAKEDKYDIIEKKLAEDLTEKFGYTFDCTNMDLLEEGDVIKDYILYQSTAFDKYGNYRLGVQAKTAIVTDPCTLEDAIKIRRGFANRIIATEVDTATVPINQNDIPLNLRGDETFYKPIPDIGEKCEDATICATRRVNYKNVTFDFQNKNTRAIQNTDAEYVADHGFTIYDMDIYCNNPDGFPENEFFAQIKGYYDQISEYAKEITLACKEIKQSGSKYTKNVGYMKYRYQHYNDPDIPWESKDGREFGNIIINFHTMTDISVKEGYKLTGR